MLLGGLITVPDWGYLNTPIAELEVIMSDLPHVQYHPTHTNYVEGVEEAARIVKADIKKKQRNGGLAAAIGLSTGDVQGLGKGATLSNGKLNLPK